MIIAPSAKAIWQQSTDKSAFVVLWDTGRILWNPGGAHDQVGWYWEGRSMPMWQTHWLCPPTGPETALSYCWLQTHLALVLPPAPLAERPIKSHSCLGPKVADPLILVSAVNPEAETWYQHLSAVIQDQSYPPKELNSDLSKPFQGLRGSHTHPHTR